MHELFATNKLRSGGSKFRVHKAIDELKEVSHEEELKASRPKVKVNTQTIKVVKEER